MTSIEQYVGVQQSSLDLISRIWTNYQKLALPKRTVNKVRSRLDNLEEYWKECRQQHHVILGVADAKIRSEHPYFTADLFGSINDRTEEVRDNLNEVLADLLGEAKPLNSGADGAKDASKIDQLQGAIRPPPVNLNPINIRKFAGNIVAWPGFRDLFTSLVGSRCDFTDVQKLHYLKDSLEGNALQLLVNIEVTEANYKAAWELLKERYENPRAIVYALLDKFLNLPKVGPNREADLRNLRDQSHHIYQSILGLSRPINMWEDQFIHIMLSKLNMQTRHDWELTQREVATFPKYKELDSYLSFRLRALETAGNSSTSNHTRGISHKETPKGQIRAHQTSYSHPKCFVCGGDHPLFQCAVFNNKSVSDRVKLVLSQERCLNCFRKGHRPKTCDSKNSCKICKLKHHTLVHFEKAKHEPNSNTTPQPGTNSNLDSTQREEVSNNCASTGLNITVLPTATVLLRSRNGRSLVVRALLDQGSQASFIAASVVQALKAETKPVSVSVSGIGARSMGSVSQSASFTVEARNDRMNAVPITALILKKVSSYIPPPCVLTRDLPYLSKLNLADPIASNSNSIQLIIGADYFGSFLREGVIRGPPGAPVAQLTTFGWIISGYMTQSLPHPNRITVNHVSTDTDLKTSISNFWEIEEIPKISLPSEEEVRCEGLFKTTHVRLKSGNYQVRLPFKTPLPLTISDNRHASKQMYLSQEIRLNRKPALEYEYNKFLREYLELGHMEKVPPGDENIAYAVYFPHHPVLKNTSSTTKVRVVFNASFRSDQGSSLNDHLLIGPKLQVDLFALILRWRSHKYVLCTDVEKMFRQIIIARPDNDFQRIFWRPAPTEDVQSFRLNTVTYGTACAPFLANRVMKQLAEDESHNFPLASSVLRTDMYVDDVMFGADDLQVLKETQVQVRQLLMAGGFHAHKWATNTPSLLCDIPAGEQEALQDKCIGEESHLKILGLYWEPTADVFSFKIADSSPVTSKRSFLSFLSHVFDPLGWVAPATICAKVLMQEMWLRKLTWDEHLPKDLSERCLRFQAELRALERLQTPRWTGQLQNHSQIELHEFCDASNVAYAAAIYMRLGTCESEYKTVLVYAKTKVAPVKMLSIPRLELCAATLLVRAVNFVVESMRLTNIPLYCWSDSSVVLSWLEAPPSRWKVFVAHRVSEIQSSIPNAIWRHVPTNDNPADCASRGITPAQLQTHPLWWQGPAWLLRDAVQWPPNISAKVNDHDSEKRKNVLTFHSETRFELPSRVSSWPKLLRIVAYVMRFIHNSRSPKARVSVAFVKSGELKKASIFVCKQAQTECFPATLRCLKSKTGAIKDKALRVLNPFLDSDGIMRVGGRLRYSNLPYDEKFPILMPTSRTAELIIEHMHKVTLHGGLQSTLRLLRQQYWVLRARNLTKKCIRSCVTCTRFKAQVMQQQMGELPTARVTPSRPFTNTGVDYAGPFQIRSTKGRGHKTHKAYCAVFVCLAVRAIHLECVDDYTTAAFLAAFDRFCSRRGLPATVYSDNGTTFVGNCVKRELSENFVKVTQDNEVQAKIANDGIEWKFIPPAAPQFGGLWEAGVKSFKYHLKRILGSFTPTFEEFSTLLCKIECVLNSRPLAPLYDDPESFDAITPGHFLTGSMLKIVPNPSVLSISENYLDRWQTIQKLHETFWKIWSADFLNSLQQRVKNLSPQPNLREGDLVLMRAPQLPPAKWGLGRVITTFPGRDNLVRVAVVRTEKGEFKRPITQLCKLPLKTDSDSRTDSNLTPS